MLRKSLLTLASDARVDAALGRVSRRGGILSYHGVVPDGEPMGALHITPSRLRLHLEVFRDRGYAFISLREFLDRLGRGRSVTRCLAITFDDAYRGVGEAVPVLRALGIPSTLFVPTSAPDAETPFWWDLLEAALAAFERPGAAAAWAAEVCGHPVRPGEEFWCLRSFIMTEGRGRLPEAIERAVTRTGSRGPNRKLLPMDWTEIARWLEWDAADVAPHTVTHPVLPRLGPADQRREMVDSLEALRARYERVLPVLAYPYGAYDATTVEVARSGGFAGAVTMDRFGTRAGEADPFRVPRLPFAGITDPRRMGFYLSGFARTWRRAEMARAAFRRRHTQASSTRSIARGNSPGHASVC